VSCKVRILPLEPEFRRRCRVARITGVSLHSYRHDQKNPSVKSFTYEELIKRDKLNLDIFWLKDESLEDSANLPDPGIIAAEIVEDLQAALAQFAEIASDLRT
jgi:hypothetical protein